MKKSFRYMLIVLLYVVMYACGSDDIEEPIEKDSCENFEAPEIGFNQFTGMDGSNQLNGFYNSLYQEDINQPKWVVTYYRDYSGQLDTLEIDRIATFPFNVLAIAQHQDSTQWIEVLFSDSSDCLDDVYEEREFFFF